MSVLKQRNKTKGGLVFGLPSSGKSTYVRSELDTSHVVWLYSGNCPFAGEGVYDLAPENLVEGMEEAQELDEAVLTVFIQDYALLESLSGMSPELAENYALVIDGMTGVRDIVLDSVSKGAFVSQQEWGAAGSNLSNFFRSVKSRFAEVWAVVNVGQDDETGKLFMQLNPDLMRRVVPMFSSKVLVYTRFRDGSLTYHTSEGELALNFFGNDGEPIR